MEPIYNEREKFVCFTSLLFFCKPLVFSTKMLKKIAIAFSLSAAIFCLILNPVYADNASIINDTDSTEFTATFIKKGDYSIYKKKESDEYEYAQIFSSKNYTDQKNMIETDALESCPALIKLKEGDTEKSYILTNYPTLTYKLDYLGKNEKFLSLEEESDFSKTKNSCIYWLCESKKNK